MHREKPPTPRKSSFERKYSFTRNYINFSLRESLCAIRTKLLSSRWELLAAQALLRRTTIALQLLQVLIAMSHMSLNCSHYPDFMVSAKVLTSPW